MEKKVGLISILCDFLWFLCFYVFNKRSARNHGKH